MDWFAAVVNPELDLLLAQSQLAAGISQHRVGKWLTGAVEQWPSGHAPLNLAWQLGLARHTGGSLNFAIDGWLAQLRHRKLIAEEQRLALQGPKLTARLIHVVPWLGLGVAQLFDLNPLGFLFGNPLGWALLMASLLMAVAAGKWTARIVRAFDAVEPNDPGVAYAGLALVLRSGLGVTSGLQLMEAKGVPIPEGLNRLLTAQTRIGAGLVQLLQTQADWERQHLRAEQRIHLAKLPIQLLYPMALLLLPQFMLLTVVPIAVGALAGTS